jgi:uncharacterized protein involved in type VI secretion and phage assembly
MPSTFYDSAAAEKKQAKGLLPTSIAPGIVKNNCDLIRQGKVLVRIPSLDQEVWARLTATGAGNGTGHFHTPNLDDEVLVALVHADPVDAYIIGGMWSTKVEPPVNPGPTDVPSKRIIRTGLNAKVGHQIEFDDLLQSITITSSPPGFEQKIKMDPKGITLENETGTVKISMSNVTQIISVEAVTGIELKSKGFVKIEGNLISIEATGPCIVSGKPVKIN